MMRAALLILLWLTASVSNSYAQNSYAQSREQYFANIDTFNHIDKNANNIIDADEALVPKMAGVTRVRHQANIAAQFRRQDRNKNGELSMLELTAPPQ